MKIRPPEARPTSAAKSKPFPLHASNHSPRQTPPAPQKRDVQIARLLADELRHVIELAGSEAGHDGREVLLDKQIHGFRVVLTHSAEKDHEVALSPRELEIARMIGKGLPNKMIADVLDISAWTVGTHLRRIFAKFGVTSRAAMVAKLLEQARFCATDQGR